MPLYFFDVTDNNKTTLDESGTDLINDTEARDQALSLLPNIARDLLPGTNRYEISVAIRDEHAKPFYEANLALNGRWWPGHR